MKFIPEVRGIVLILKCKVLSFIRMSKRSQVQPIRSPLSSYSKPFTTMLGRNFEEEATTTLVL
jgi:hypothetical protein